MTSPASPTPPLPPPSPDASCNANSALAPGNCPITHLVSQVLEERYITQVQYQTLSALVLADGTVDEVERQQINRLFDAIQTGRVKIRAAQ
jgi:hypothetical protein